MTEARKSQIAGTWYPGDPTELGALVDRLVNDAPRADIPGQLVALVSPHAGLVYSGHIAAAGYRHLEGARFDAVILLGPCHRGGVGLAVMPGGAIETPLGTVGIDEELVSALAEADPNVRVTTAPHELEHSLEVQFPFLQRFLPNVPVVPVLMGYQTPTTIAAAARALQQVIAESRRSVLMVASSDLSHYKSADVAARMDKKVAKLVEEFAPDGLMSLLEHHHEHACGGGPLVAVMRAARVLGGVSATILRYGDSGDVSGDKAEVVGYLSAAFCRSVT